MTASFGSWISAAMNDLISIPWLEELLITASIGFAFILTHRGLASSRRSKPCKFVSTGPSAEDCGSNTPPRPQKSLVRKSREVDRRFPLEAATRTPQTSMELPGVTDRRFVGQIISYKEEEGYGFISCAELYPHFHRDVFLHKFQIGAFGVGATVSFGVFLNKNGQPQAKDLEVPLDAMLGHLADLPDGLPTWGLAKSSVPTTAMRQPLNPRAKPFQTAMTSESDVTTTLTVSEEEERALSPDSSASAAGKATYRGKAGGEKRWVAKSAVPAASLQWVPKQ